MGGETISLKRQIILGAGASAIFNNDNVSIGYPIGSKLLNDIIALHALEVYMSKRSRVEFSIGEIDFSIERDQEFLDFLKKISNFAQKLKNANSSTIDNFISMCGDEDLRSVGMSLIKGIIESRAFAIKSYQIKWYAEILNLVFPQIDKSTNKYEELEKKLKEIKIITFNYDLSLEEFLYYFLSEIYLEKSEAERVKKYFELILNKIEHVYGSIRNKGEIFDFLSQKKQTDINNPKDVFERIFEIYNEKEYKSINIINRNQNGANNNDLLTNYIASTEEKGASSRVVADECEYLYVLGFGFDINNIKQIKLDRGNIWNAQCFVTNYAENRLVNRKLERVIVNYLSCCRKIGITQALKSQVDFSAEDVEICKQELVFPVISNSSISDALNNSFSLIEQNFNRNGMVNYGEAIFIDSYNGRLSSFYMEYKKYLKDLAI